ncbi:MAG: peptide chain release factor 1 [Spirochaetaceae bacterium]
MFEKLQSLVNRHEEVQTLLADPGVMKDQGRYRSLTQEYAHLSEIVEEYATYESLSAQLNETQQILESEIDDELRDLAKAEKADLEARRAESQRRLRLLLVPRDPMDSNNVIVEIRAGTGGDEATLFAADLFRMYSRYAERQRWKIEIMSSSGSEVGGYKEIIFSVAGKMAFGTLKYESGGHRVQRIPTTESGGRIHTSACTVAVLPEVEDTEIQLSPDDLRIDVFRSSGPGGQSVNTTDSAVRVTHIPTGTVVTCQDEKSQLKNKAKALRVLKARLYEVEEARKNRERADARKSQIGSGDRSERIRTYNFPQNRLTDHRINLTLYKLDSIMEGYIDEVIDAIQLEVQQELLAATE